MKMRDWKVWGVLGLLLALGLALTIGYGQEVAPVQMIPKLPPEFLASIQKGICPPGPSHPGVFPATPGMYTLFWFEDQTVPAPQMGVARKHTLAWYNPLSRWAFGLKEVGYSDGAGSNPDDPNGHDSTGVMQFTLPSWALEGGNGLLALAYFDRPLGAAVYYSDQPTRARVRFFTPKTYVICWENWVDNDFNDQIDILVVP